MNRIPALLMVAILTACSATREAMIAAPEPPRDFSFGYHPIDPLPVKLIYQLERDSLDMRSKHDRLMNSLPDEIMRLAIGEIRGNGQLTFSTAEIGYAGRSYLVILDYIKFDTKAFGMPGIQIGANSEFSRYAVSEPQTMIPVYVGIGLRLTASVKVHKGYVELGNLLALGAAAEAQQVSGTLVIQTLGISGESISSLIPIPGEINETTIQNAILAIGAIKAKIYEDDVQISPRLVGYYNSLGGDKVSSHQIISTFLNQQMVHRVE